MIYKLGAHLSTSNGLTKTLDSLIEKGGNCLQLFSSSPMMWSDSKFTDTDIQDFINHKNELEIGPTYFHACYLINFADGNETGKKSLKSLIFELNLASKMQIRGSVVHTGSFKEGKMPVDNYLESRTSDSYKNLISQLKTVLAETPKDTVLILENAGNRKIGRTIEQLSNILEDINDDRMKVCLDTCHLHAAGYDLNSQDNFENFLSDFDNKIGFNKLELMHLNDSRDEFGSLRDRHENIGEGKVGIQVFKNLLNNPRTKQLPFIIETPGFDDKGPDKENLDILKGFIK
jgi:apurinic endonuclease APN1